MDSYEDAYFDDDEIHVEPPDGDAIEHLWNAAHELLRAVRTVVDAADEFVASQRAAMTRRVPREHAGDAGPRVRNIDIDGRDDWDAHAPGGWSPGSPETPGAPGATPR